MSDNETFWWILQVTFPELYHSDFFAKPLPRQTLAKEAFGLIPAKIRITKNQNMWGLANLEVISNSILACKLTVLPPFSRVGEESAPGFLQQTHEARFFTLVFLHLPLQIIMVQKAHEISRYARSANTFAQIFEQLLSVANQSLGQDIFYDVSVTPICRTGSFTEWVRNIDELIRIKVHYVGPNLPVSGLSLVHGIKDSAKKIRDDFRANSVDVVANHPKPSDEEVNELDVATSNKQLDMIATGMKSDVIVRWSSSEKPMPQSVKMYLTEDQISNTPSLGELIQRYVEDTFGKRK